jgi:phosphoribosylamine--glycine ligase
MNVLVLGSGGREHALAWKISQSPQLDNLYIAPGNGGTSTLGQNIDLNPGDFDKVKEAVLSHQIEIVVVGPEQPLAEGVVDFFKGDSELNNIPIIGPDKKGAQLEGSKDFANRFMKKHSIPTADYKTITIEQISQGYDFLESLNPPYVLKSDGLAAGKGVIITDDIAEAKKNLIELLEGKFGEASKKVVIEEFLQGKEFSAFILTDGEDYKLLPFAKDYKRIGENDTGPNTGGMGAVSPVPYISEELQEKVKKKVIEPTLKGLKEEGIEYKGFLYFGLMKVNDEPYVIEYNVRLGDPEAQPVLSLMKSDLLKHLQDLHEKNLQNNSLECFSGSAAIVILASEGYPGAYEKGKQISLPAELNHVQLFHAGTKRSNGRLFTSGGRVMGVTARADNYENALGRIYKSIDEIEFSGMYFRKDIGFDL